MKHYSRAFAVCALLLPLSPSALAAPAVGTTAMALALNQFLSGTPMANLGDTLVQQGLFYSVDPRLIVAIAGAQTHYGAVASGTCANPAVTNDPFYLLGCIPEGFSYASIAAAIQDLAQNLKRNYTLSEGPQNTIDLINLAAPLYCIAATGCASPSTWAVTVEMIYTNPVLAGGGNPADLSFAGTKIDFEQFMGSPTLFSVVDARRVITFDTVTTTFTGGALLDAAHNLPVDASVVYGTAGFLPNNGMCTGCAQTIEIDFLPAVSTVSFFLINGNVVSANFDTSDGVNTIVTTLPSNAASGVKLVTLARPNITKVTIFAEPTPTSTCCNFDFFIDNVTYYPP